MAHARHAGISIIYHEENMSITIAKKTLAAIDKVIKADQGASFRHHLGQVIPHMKDAYRADDDGGHRSHMGASLIGNECPRAIWYGFRWATKPNFDARLIRLFNRGHLEEARFIALLLVIGCEVYQQDKNGNQFRISHAAGHFGGSGDGVVIGCPDLPPGTAALTEFKTSSDKLFQELKAKGIREAKFVHYVQMNIYMRKMGLAAGLYMVVNKNTDELYGEILTLDTSIADQFLMRGEKLVWMDHAPDKISESPGFWKCRFCDHRPVCHLKAAPDRNCRTCAHSAPSEDGGWVCTLHEKKLTKEDQLAACENYEQHRSFE